MKKRSIILAIIIIATIVLFPACRDVNNAGEIIEYDSGSYHDKNWDETIGTYKEAVISDKDTALAVAQAIYDGMEKSDDADKYTAKYVFYDNQDEIWIVSFWEDSSSTNLGGDCNIAIRKADGKVLRIWFGE